MSNKDILKTKLAEAVKAGRAEHASEVRRDLEMIMRHGPSNEADLVKEAIIGRAKNLFKQTSKVGADGKTTFGPSPFEKGSKQFKEVAAVLGALGAGGTFAAKHGKKALEWNKLRKMSPLKRALTKGFGKDTIGRKALGFGAGAAGLTVGIKGVEGLADSISSPIKKRSAFNNMMSDNPALKKEDSKDVKRVFNTLFRFNPKMAGDPLVAGSFMKRTLQFKDEGIQPVDVKTLTEVSRNMSSGKASNSILGNAFLGGAKELASFAG